MKKIALAFVMSFALLASTTVMAQDANKAPVQKCEKKTSCCTKKKENKGCCSASAEKKSCCADKKK